MALSGLVFLCIFVIIMVESQSQYPYQHWMEDMSTEHAIDTVGDSLYTKTIFDIVLPGASKAGMNFVNYNDNEYIMATDKYSDILSSLPIEQKKLWSERQKSSIYTLLMSGVRFLDLRFEYELHEDDHGYYCHNGLLGQPLLQILDQILSFVLNIGTKEIILIYLNDFISSWNDTNDVELTGLFDKIIEHPLINNIADSTTNNIHKWTLSNLVENNINIIIFTDQYPANVAINKSKYFYNGLSYLHQTENLNSDRNEYNKIIAILSGLSGGWNKDKLNLIYWTLDNNNSSFMKQEYIFDSYYNFSYGLIKELHSTLSSYNKLYFGNVILIDFFELTDIMEQILTLNYKYFQCNDHKDACPIITNLTMEYNDNSISTACNTDLQQLCKRSCGICPIIHGNPGDQCLTNNDCISPLYTIYSQSNIGECFISDYKNKTKSFCLVPNAIESCGIYQDSTCYSRFDCKGSCIADYQCQTGYCYTIDSICMSINYDDDEQNEEILQQHYDPIQSRKVSVYLKELEPFRPKGYNVGTHEYRFEEMNCNNDIHDIFDCILSNKNSNEYISSLVGIMLIPFILSLVMFSIYCCIWPWFCFCEEKPKKCCCVTIIGHPQSGITCLSHWIIYGLLSVFSVIILYASIDAMINNSKINDNLFGEQDSVQYTAIKLLDQIHDEFSEFGNLAQGLIQNIDGYLFNVQQLTQKTNNITKNNGNSFLSELENMKTNYNQKLTLHAMVQNPLQIEKDVNFSIDCSDCFNISYKIELIDNEFNETMIEIINKLNKMMNGTMNFQNIIILTKQNINDLWNIFDFYVNISKEMRNSTTMYLEYAYELDSKYRGTAIIAILTFLFILVIMPIFGVFIVKYSAWFFKINWCCAMWLGSILMFIMSWSLLITTGFADFCIRLDSFETEMDTSDLGYLWNIDNSTSLLLNTCFTGKSIYNTFDTYILDWNQWKNQLNDVFTIDMTDYIMLSQLQNFIIYTNNLSVNNFPETNKYIFIANNIGNYCGYNKPNVTFKRDNLLPFDDQNSINWTYWDDTNFRDNGLCLEAYYNASYMVQTEYLLNAEIKSVISLLQMTSNNLLYQYENVIYSINLILKEELQNISCKMRAIFNSMDEILYNFSNCGYVGKTYQDFKESTCIEMWSNLHNILRNLTILALITIPIVLLSLCMDFMYDPKVDFSEINKEKNIRNASVEVTEKQNDEKENKSRLSVVGTTKKKKEKMKRAFSDESNDGFISVDGSVRSKSSKNKIVELSVKYQKISNVDVEFEETSILKEIPAPTPIPVAIPEDKYYNIHDVNGNDEEKEADNNSDNSDNKNAEKTEKRVVSSLNVEMDNKERFIRVNNIDNHLNDNQTNIKLLQKWEFFDVNNRNHNHNEYNLSYHRNNSNEDKNNDKDIAPNNIL